MTLKKIVSIRLGAAHADVVAMAAARTEALRGQGADEEVSASGIYRELLREALLVRRRDCARRHLGPIGAGRCGHCGGQP